MSESVSEEVSAVLANGSPSHRGRDAPDIPRDLSDLALTWPSDSSEPAAETPSDERSDGGMTPDAGRAERARAHEAAAGALAARGDWQRAYRHLQAAVTLTRATGAPDSSRPEQLHSEVDRLRRERAEAREQSRRDTLTAGYNRRYLDERLATLRGHDRDGQAAGCVALADVDHFKQINDAYGHGLGDEVLRRLVAVMSSGLPADGFCARYGGEEFALVLPDVGDEDAVALCESVRARVDGQNWDDLGVGLRVTISVGVACLAPPASALGAADALLYVAKRSGRNAVAFRDPDGAIRLAGPASRRRGILSATRALRARP